MREGLIQLISLLLGTIFLVLSFRLSRNKEHILAPVVIVISAVFFFCGLFPVSGVLNSLTLEQVACWAVASAFLVTAFRFLQKERISLAFTVFIFAAIFFFCSLSGVQGLLKTGMLSAVTKQLIEYGEKLNTFQLTMDKMNRELSEQQEQIESQQIRLKGQESRIRNTQANIAAQQENITNQYSQNPVDIYHNVLLLVLCQYDMNNSSISVQYVKDTRETNLFQKIEMQRNSCLIDGSLF